MFRSLSVTILSLSMTAIAVAAGGEDRTDVEYGRAGKFSLRLDAHIPEGTGPFPAAILVHGGAWVAGDRTNNVQPLFQPLSDAGFVWFSISYRLGGDLARNPIGAALMMSTAIADVRQAVTYVKEHASEYRVDPNKIALIGESAGGQLALMAALRPGSSGSVRAVVAFYTPSDLASLAQTSSLIPDSVRQAVRDSRFDDLLLAGLTEFSPVNWVRTDSPPFLLIHGTDDGLVPIAQSERMCEKMRAAGATCELYPVKGGGHGIRAWESARLTGYKQPMVRWLLQILAQP